MFCLFVSLCCFSCVSTYLIIYLARCQVVLCGRGGKLDVLQPAPCIWFAGIHAEFDMAGPIQDLQQEKKKGDVDFDRYQTRLLCPNTAQPQTSHREIQLKC